ncbi:hypothetical protein DPMN_108088 [Dreissena polymorpha]|uniref:Uncharacterized protein n=1 Tax=Dreissena polymorpha TaxID=45954 RepID=A0A9D4K844_DREPO|nr:hypothetical protein DPMN_108088 [Dreissena polymorpha]
MPLTSGTTCHRDATHIGHNVTQICPHIDHGHIVTQRCLSHRTQRVTDMTLTSDTT